MEKKLSYETKCRRCGNITEWSFSGEYNNENWKKLSEYCFMHFNSPSVCRCKICGKETIQDYIAYTNLNKDLM